MRVRACCLILLCMLPAGCLRPKQSVAPGLGTQAFSGPAAVPAAPARPSAVVLPREQGFDPQRGGPLAIETTVGVPQGDPDAAPAEAPRLVDAMVGDINGNPIFARSFLEPMEGTLRARARDSASEAEWRAFATRHIRTALDAQIANTLLREEALASLEPQRKQGLRYLLENYRQTLISKRGGGSETRLARALEEQTGRSIGEEIELAREQFLIEEVALARLKDTSVISMADVRHFYERNYEQFNPPPTAVLYAIQVPADDEDAVRQVQARLEAGEPFKQVAGEPFNFFQRDAGGRRTVRIAESFAQTPVFTGRGYEELDRAARGLQRGQWAGPVRVGDWVWWVYLDEIREVRFTFYEMQLFLERYLSAVRRNEAKDRLVRQLMENASFTSQPEMVARLVDIAAQWYWAPEAQARAQRQAP